MNRLLKATGTLLLSFTLAASASAIPMAGSIEINHDDSDFSFDSSWVDFSQPTSAEVNDATGDFAHLIGAEVEYKDFDYTAIPAGGIEDLWTIASAGISFSLVDLLYSDYTAFGDWEFLNLAGTGRLNVDGQGSAPAWWSFSADSNNGVHNFSSTTTVPDNGASIALLGLGLLVLGTAQRLRKRDLAA